MILKILIKDQIQDSFFKSNESNIGLSVDQSIIHNGIFWNYVTVDTSWSFNGTYIFPVFLTGVVDDNLHILSRLKDFICENSTLFDNHLKLVIVNLFECHPEIISIIDEIGLITKTYFISCDYAIKFQKHNFIYTYVNYLGQILEPISKPIEYYPVKTYINLNRSIRYHRCLMMNELINNDLFDSGYNTWWVEKRTELIEDFPFFESLLTQQYATLDVPRDELDNMNKFCFTTPISYCENSFLFLVTETYSTPNITYITEKTYKPISIGMPFIIFGPPGTLSFLRQLGYVTFHDWWDESYDLDIPINERANVIVKNLKYLNTLSDENKIKLRKDLSAVCEYNLNLYTNLRKKDQLFEAFKLIEKNLI